MGQSNRVLVAHASRLRSTAEMARDIGGVLNEGGASVDVQELTQITELDGYDLVVIGSAIRYDHWLP